MISTRAKPGSSTCSVTPIRNTIISDASRANDVILTPAIHVHHFHHHSCLHQPELSCQNPQSTPASFHSEDQYAVILNPNYPLRQAPQPVQATKQSAFTYTAARKPTSTAIIRHPIQTSLALQRRNFHSPDPTSRLTSSSIPNADCTSFATPISSPCLLTWSQQQLQQQNQCLGVPVNGAGCSLISGQGFHSPTCIFSQMIAGKPISQNTAARALSTNSFDSHCHYRLATPGNTSQHPGPLDQQRRYHELIDCGIPENLINGQPPSLFRSNCGSGSSAEDSNAQHRRSKSQPPHRLLQQHQGIQLIRPDSSCMNNTLVSKNNQHRNNHSRQTQPTESSSNSHYRRSHLPHWLFPHDHRPKNSRSPPSPWGPPPPPPRGITVRSKPLTRSVEVQTESAISPPCRCNEAELDSKLFENEKCTRSWCSARQGQPIMLHHYHVHHYYHCEDQQPISDSTHSASEPAGFRTSSPLIKLSATWPPNMAVTSEEQETRNRTESLQDECEISPSPEEITNRDPPAHVSNALRAVESPQEEITIKGDTQENQRRIFLQNINQLKRTGWYWGPLTIEEAELLLKDRPNGSFLVRDSGHELYILSVSFRAENRTYHTRIEHMGGKFGFAVQGDPDTTSSSIAQFIDHVIAESERGRTRFFLRQSALTTSNSNDLNGEGTANQLENESHHVEARLLYPVSRFLVVRSLAHLCRFEILLKVRKDQIDQLPLPDQLKKYLHERQYYTEFTQAYLESVGDAQNKSGATSSS